MKKLILQTPGSTRHNGNWGFLFDESTGESNLAPIYDCGSCLLPQTDNLILAQAIDFAVSLEQEANEPTMGM